MYTITALPELKLTKYTVAAQGSVITSTHYQILHITEYSDLPNVNGFFCMTYVLAPGMPVLTGGRPNYLKSYLLEHKAYRPAPGRSVHTLHLELTDTLLGRLNKRDPVLMQAIKTHLHYLYELNLC